MRVKTVRASVLAKAVRLDCWYFLSSAASTVTAVALAKRKGMRFRQLSALASRVNHPQRYKRALAARGEDELPYLRPYDVFNYLPEPADFVSKTRTENLCDYHLQVGQILQTRSGRNLGPAVIVDEYLAQFVMSDDMIRVEVQDEAMRYHVLAYLNSHTGRQMLRRDKTGSVIDHLSEDQVANQEIALPDDSVLASVSRTMKRAVMLRGNARTKLSKMLANYEASLPQIRRSTAPAGGWTIRARSFDGRLDAAYYDPLVASIRRQLLKLDGKRVGEVATVLKPGGRYKTNYVGPDHGRPLLSGAQLLQTNPINLQYMSPAVFKRIEDYELHAGWIAYPADGRAEEELGTPVIITRDRDGWLASGHVGRVIANKGVDAGWLFLALKTDHAQLQLKARASGSVVDSTFEHDLESVILPPPLDVDGGQVRQLWDDFAEAQALEDEACSIVDAAILELHGQQTKS